MIYKPSFTFEGRFYFLKWLTICAMICYDVLEVIKVLITKKELSDKTRFSIGTIDRLMRDGMPHVKLERAVRFDYEEVERWLKDGGKSNVQSNKN